MTQTLALPIFIVALGQYKCRQEGWGNGDEEWDETEDFVVDIVLASGDGFDNYKVRVCVCGGALRR